MEYETNIDIVHLHAIEETIRYAKKYGTRATYDGMVKHLSWYWMDHGRTMGHKPQGWVLDWIKTLVGEPV